MTLQFNIDSHLFYIDLFTSLRYGIFFWINHKKNEKRVHTVYMIGRCFVDLRVYTTLKFTRQPNAKHFPYKIKFWLFVLLYRTYSCIISLHSLYGFVPSICVYIMWCWYVMGYVYTAVDNVKSAAFYFSCFIGIIVDVILKIEWGKHWGDRWTTTFWNEFWMTAFYFFGIFG